MGGRDAARPADGGCDDQRRRVRVASDELDGGAVDLLLLGFRAGERDAAIGLRLREVAAYFSFDEMRELAVAGGGEADAIRLAQQTHQARSVWPEQQERTALVGEAGVGIDELHAIGVGTVADQIVDELDRRNEDHAVRDLLRQVRCRVQRDHLLRQGIRRESTTKEEATLCA